MGRKRQKDLSEREILRDKVDRLKVTTDIQEIVEATHDPHPKIRIQALHSMCPCSVYDKIDLFWDRVIEMVDDPDQEVRATVLHVLCDGSPDYLEDRIIRAVQTFNSDSNKKTRRRAHKVLGSYARTGKWNIL